MKTGGAIRRAAIASLVFSVGGCGSKNPPAKDASDSPTPVATIMGSIAGAAGTLGTDPAEADYPDPSKLLETYKADAEQTANTPAPTSRSGLSLQVFERGPGEPWLVHIVNRGTDPVDLAADTRLLWFKVKVPGVKKESVCRLPEPLATGSQPEPRLIVHLEPGEGVADQLDPRLYCFADGDQRLLVPGAEVTPHFGWAEAPPKKRWKRGKLVEEPVLQKPPFVARQSLVAEHESAGTSASQRVSDKAAARLSSAGVTGADKQLEGAPLTLRSEYSEWARPGNLPPVSDDADGGPPPPPPRIGFRLVQGSDARAEHDATVQLTLSNQSELSTYVYFRREMVTFEVIGPTGVVHCLGRLDERTPQRSSFLHLNRRESRKYAVRLAELCPNRTFTSPGLYLVYARFDATLDGAEQGIDAFVGPVYSKTPATVRIRTGETPIFQKRPMMRTESAAANQSDKGTQ
ncbi:MAG TPA: hypothetical protein VKP30_01380 [Polyangiaceae bacterium]|nr:hypothetical protein [Polyangiaceae bacterium]